MKYVIDSSVAFKWVVAEPDADKAEQLGETTLCFSSTPEESNSQIYPLHLADATGNYPLPKPRITNR